MTDKYLQIAISELQNVIEELTVSNRDMNVLSESFDKAKFIVENFIEGKQIHSSDAEAGSDLYWKMTTYEDRYE